MRHDREDQPEGGGAGLAQRQHRVTGEASEQSPGWFFAERGSGQHAR